MALEEHADDHLIDGKRRRQSRDDEEKEEDHGEEVAEEHFREGDRERLEDERRARIRSEVGAEERREDHEARHDGDERIDDAGDDGGLHHVFLLVQVRGERDHHAEAERQRKEDLPQDVEKKFRRDLREVGREVEAHAFHGVVEREVADHHDEEAQKERRHQVLHRLFNPLDHALSQDHPVDEHEDEGEARDREGRIFDLVGVEGFGNFLRDGTRKVEPARKARGAQKNVPDVGEHPAADHHVVGENPEGPQKPRVAEDLPEGARLLSVVDARAHEGVDAVGLAAPADDVFDEDDRDAHEQHHETEGEHVGAAAVFTHEIRKAPGGAETDGRAGNRQDVCQTAGPGLACTHKDSPELLVIGMHDEPQALRRGIA